jgi:hypothetical protein
VPTGEELYAEAMLRGDGSIGEVSEAEDMLFKKAQEVHNAKIMSRRNMLLASQLNHAGNLLPAGAHASSEMSADFLVSAVLHKVRKRQKVHH